MSNTYLAYDGAVDVNWKKDQRAVNCRDQSVRFFFSLVNGTVVVEYDSTVD
jgi:hypothetical protein